MAAHAEAAEAAKAQATKVFAFMGIPFGNGY
jgi:hypothetical protein